MKSIEKLAQEFAGNWLSADGYFSWWGKPDNVDHNWGIYFLRHRDSDLLSQSNYEQILQIMAPYTDRGTAFVFNASCSLYGWRDNLAILVYTKAGKITRAFETFYKDIYCALEDYPSLNDERWTELEYETAFNSIRTALQYDISSSVENYELLLLDDQIQYAVYRAIDGDNGNADNTDGQGFYPSVDELITALLELGRIRECCDLATCDCDYPYIAIENPVYPCGCSRLSYVHTCNQFCGHSYGCKCWGE